MSAERWLALGDSITWGFPTGPSASWARHASEALGLAVDNQGVNGDTLDGMHDRLSRLVAGGRRWRFAVVTGGSNDVALGFRLPAMADHLARITALLQASGIPVAVGLPPPIWFEPGLEARLVPWRAHLREHYRYVIDFPAVFASADEALLPDGIHPSEAAYESMAEVAVPVLRQIHPEPTLR